MILDALQINITIGDVAGYIITIGSLCGAVSAIYLFIKKFRRKIADDVNKEQNFDDLIGDHEEFEKKIKNIEDMLVKTTNYIKKVDERTKAIENDLTELKKEFSKHVEQNERQTCLLVEEARITLLNEMEASISEGWASTEKKRRIGDLYHWYGKNGGNHGVGDIFDIFKNLPSVKEEVKKNNE